MKNISTLQFVYDTVSWNICKMYTYIYIYMYIDMYPHVQTKVMKETRCPSKLPKIVKKNLTCYFSKWGWQVAGSWNNASNRYGYRWFFQNQNLNLGGKTEHNDFCGLWSPACFIPCKRKNVDVGTHWLSPDRLLGGARNQHVTVRTAQSWTISRNRLVSSWKLSNIAGKFQKTNLKQNDILL